jgi:hypothetical protein
MKKSEFIAQLVNAVGEMMLEKPTIYEEMLTVAISSAQKYRLLPPGSSVDEEYDILIASIVALYRASLQSSLTVGDCMRTLYHTESAWEYFQETVP